ncbi:MULTISPECIES: SOS response-associated peptidase [unclassified Leptolyngbya]|uniref:SOS response-associated peptidase n=1 Tax=unclassified Leptolyngbya TaxID=2650499 RepID=UPI00168621BF|nr:MULTISPECIES: SOS response-associated peptidase [unclassified Leptolyngbya]MBD1912618.1 SOS response-associated peptidase [Leptolyngbya sp. FACHB-8]MBD2156788.1 SOS response-associated peptidase [Leptolyngbya sp. FACHB-16]
MCGRFTQSQPAEKIARQFGLETVPTLPARYNIAPTQDVPVVLGSSQERQFAQLYWGLIPSWSKDPKMGSRMINARSETVTEKPSFRTAFRKRRCLVVADGFYEWQRTNGSKQAHFFYLPDGEGERSPFAFAGLWEHWESPDGDVIRSCTILTTEANEALRPIHERMPVILPSDAYEAWLQPNQKEDILLSLLRPYADDAMAEFPVGPEVNSPRNDSPELLVLNSK